MTINLDELERKAKEGIDRGLPYYDWLSGRLHPRIVLALIERVRGLESAALRASAELRHAYRQPAIDRGLVERAVKCLECATTPKDPQSEALRRRPDQEPR